MSSTLIYSPPAARVLNSIQSNEHTACDRTPYCYLIGWSRLNLWYYGRRTAIGCHPNEFWKSYKTSSVGDIRKDGTHSVESCVKTNGDPDIIQIRRVFTDVKTCIAWENRFLQKVKAAIHPMFLNKTNGDTRFDGTNQVVVKDKNDNFFKVSKDSDLYSSGEVISIALGAHWYKKIDDLDGEFIYAKTNDPRVVSGKLVGASYGYGAYVDSNGISYRVKTNDPRVVSGELFSPNKDKTLYKNIEGHVIMTTVDDPRVVSGEYIGISREMITVEDSAGNTFQVSVSDPRYVSGELMPYSKNKVSCVDANGNRFYTSKYDPRYVSGELKAIQTGTKIYIDSTGIMYRLLPTDSMIVEMSLTLFNLKKHRQELSQREEVKRLVELAKSKQISLSASVRWTIDLSPVWEFVKNSPPGSRYGTRSGKQSQKEAEDRAENIKALRNRPEVLYLKEIANQRNIKLKPYWEWKNDISEFRDIILNGPANVSYASRKKKSPHVD